jgi:hypothetical protein
MEGYVCSTWCELVVVGEYREYTVVLGTGLVSGPSGR